MAVLIEDIQSRVTHLGPETTIGRDRSCSLTLADAAVDPSHAKIRIDPEGNFVLTDLGSSFGTYVCSVRVSEKVLVEGDELVFGGTCMIFRENPEGHRSKPLGCSDGEAVSSGNLPIFESVWARSEDFLSNYEEKDGPPLLFHPGEIDRVLPPEAEPGVLMSIRIRLKDKSVPVFRVNARVIERREHGEPRGLLFELIEEEAPRHELILACAQGDSIPHFRRRHERVACQLAVSVDAGARKEMKGTAIEISEGGLHLVPSLRLKQEMVVTISIEFGDRKIRLWGRVASIVPEGPQQGAGIEFLFDSAGQRNEVADRVALLRSKRQK